MRELETSRSRSEEAGRSLPYNTGIISYLNFYNGIVTDNSSKPVVNSTTPYYLYGAPQVNTAVETRRVMDDVVTENYEARSSNGEIIMNDCQTVKRTWTGLFGQCSVTIDPWMHPNGSYRTDTLTGYIFNMFNESSILSYRAPDIPDSDDYLADRAISRAYAQCNDAEALLGVSVAEMHKTCRMLKKAYGRVLFQLQGENRILKRLRQGYGLKKPRSLSVREIRKLAASAVPGIAKLANEWLEIRYGWRPLCYEIRDLVTAFDAVGDRTRRSRIVSEVAAFPTSQTQDSVWVECVGEYGRILGELGIMSSKTKKAKAGLIVKWDHSKISSATLFGGEEVFLSAWELVPYSFVIDWLFNTADYIASWQPRFNVEILGSWVTIEEEHKDTFVLLDANSYLYPSYVLGTAASGLESFTYFRRRRWSNPAKPILPHINVRLNWAKLVDILALSKRLVSSELRI